MRPGIERRSAWPGREVKRTRSGGDFQVRNHAEVAAAAACRDGVAGRSLRARDPRRRLKVPAAANFREHCGHAGELMLLGERTRNDEDGASDPAAGRGALHRDEVAAADRRRRHRERRRSSRCRAYAERGKDDCRGDQPLHDHIVAIPPRSRRGTASEDSQRPTAAWRRRKTVSRVTAASKMTPVTMNWVSGFEPCRLSPFAIAEMRRAPTTPSLRLPRPPKRLVPPMTAAEIASRRIVPPPAFRSTEVRRAAKTTPPSAAIALEIMKTRIRIRLTAMPARRAASALPPTAYTCRPNVVRLATHVQKIRSATTSTPANGTPPPLFKTLTTK